MSAAPYQLWLDLPAIKTFTLASGTATVTTETDHGLNTGAYVQVAGTATSGGAITSGVGQITVTTSTRFKVDYASNIDVEGSVASVDLLAPLDNWAAGTARQQAFTADISAVNLTANGDGSGATMSARIIQEVTPSGGPWFSLIPDQSRIRFAFADTGTNPGTADIRFLGYVSSFTSNLNGSGQGTDTTVNINDANTMLDRIVVFGKTSSTAIIPMYYAGRSSNVATIRTARAHGFEAGQKITVNGVSGGKNATFDVTQATISLVAKGSGFYDDRFTYTNTGTDVSNGNTPIAYTVSPIAKSKDSVLLTAMAGDNAWVQTGDSIGVILNAAFSAPSGDIAGVKVQLGDTSTTLFKIHPGASVIKKSNTTFELRFPAAITGTMPPSFTGYVRVMRRGSVAWDASVTSGQASVSIKTGTTENDAVKRVLAVANASHSTDYPMLRMVNTAGTTGIAGATSYTPSEPFFFPTTTLRSALDSLVEVYQSDSKARRYYVNTNATLVYETADSSAVPTYATAPYKIIVTGAGTPNTTTAAATVAPYGLTVSYDHETTKRAQFNVPAGAGQEKILSTIYTYTDFTTDPSGQNADEPRYTARLGAPMTEGVVDFPNSKESLAPVAAAAWMLERHKPLLSGYFELRGAGTAAHNKYGFLSGYKQSGTASYAVASWSPGQWVDITAAGLSLSGMYRVEQVSLSFEPASYTQVVGITFNRKNPVDLASIIAGQRS